MKIKRREKRTKLWQRIAVFFVLCFWIVKAHTQPLTNMEKVDSVFTLYFKILEAEVKGTNLVFKDSAKNAEYIKGYSNTLVDFPIVHNVYFNEVVRFMEGVTFIKSPNTSHQSSFAWKYIPTSKTLYSWKNWIVRNRNRLWWNASKRRVEVH